MKPLIDWLTATFSAVDVEKLLSGLALVTGARVSAIKLPHGGNGFTDAVEFRAFTDFEFVPFARAFFGGDHQNGRMMLQITGSGCGSVDWPSMAAWLPTLPDVRLTRVDVAVDLHDGEFTVDDAVTWHGEGLFKNGGRDPKTRTDGDWLQRKEGRTLYIGVAQNGKQLRAYEKGKQLGDLESDWVRFEVQFGNRDRVIPLDILTDPGKYFVGAYPAMQRLLAFAGERIKTITDQARITCGRALTSLSQAYGKWLNLFRHSGIDPSDLVDALSVREVPERVNEFATPCWMNLVSNG